MANDFVSWQIDTNSPEKLQQFYANLFDWEVDPAGGHVQMLKTKTGQSVSGGIHLNHDPEESGQMAIRVQVDDVQAYLDKAKSLGGKTIEETHQVGSGNTVATFSDPEGNVMILVSDPQLPHAHEHVEPGQHGHSHGGPGGHTHGAVDPSIVATERGLWAVKWSFVGLISTALFQVVIVAVSGSVALLADTIHNFGDASTAIPLWIAFTLAKRKASQRFTYGYGRGEDFAGLLIVVAILLSGLAAGYVSLVRLWEPRTIEFPWVVVGAALVGFLGNEGVALFRMKVGKEIGSAALIADGYHARVDGLTSLAVLFGAVGSMLGYPIVDAIVGLVISVFIFRILWSSSKLVLGRLLDGVDPELVDQLRHAAQHSEGVLGITEVRARWLGHQVSAELNIAVSPKLSVEKAHAIAIETRHQMLHDMPHLANVTIHIDPAGSSGEAYHRVADHVHGDLPAHSHP